ncbi:MAG: hypothetical protein EXS25_09630 [Pedosphaera sp.]|nr:hypothetical protein [Pedosphaera sp.]
MKRQRSSASVDYGWMGVINRGLGWCLFIGILGFILAQYVPLIETNRLLRKTLADWRETESQNTQMHATHLRRIDGLRNDPRTVERTARELLQLARPDETVLLFVDSADSKQAPVGRSFIPTSR